MEVSERAEEACPALYDIELGGSPPEVLRARHPSMTVGRTGAQTALRPYVDGPEGLDALLRNLSSMGLVLTGVHLLAGDRPTVAAGGRATTGLERRDRVQAGTYEVRVAGSLGHSLLRFLGCAHYPLPERVVVRLACTGQELARFVQDCMRAGVTVDRVRRVAPGREPAQPARPAPEGTGSPVPASGSSARR
jgi:hypothetical protein